MNKSLVFGLLLILYACWPALPGTAFAEAEKTLSREEQNKEALKAFEKILEMTENNDRAGILPQLEAAYFDIIRRFPDAYLTQESYWRIMLIYLTDFNPPALAKAESLREEFLKKYPDSRLKDLMESTLSDAYYKSGQWEKLAVFYTPSIKKSIESGRFSKVADIFMYSEAKFRMKDLYEAEKGYKIVIATFPEAKESALAKKRLEEIDAARPKRP